MEQVRAQRAPAGHGAGGGVMRTRRMIAAVCVALVACVLVTGSAAAQLVEQQALRHGAPPAPPRFDVDSAIAERRRRM